MAARHLLYVNLKLASVRLAVIAVLVACGNAPARPPSAGDPPPQEPIGGVGHGGSVESPPQLDEFHDVLAPLWRDQSADRQTRACARLEALEQAADSLAHLDVIEARAEWDAGVARLKAAVGTLRAACTTGGNFAAAFRTVHADFYALVEIAGVRYEDSPPAIDVGALQGRWKVLSATDGGGHAFRALVGQVIVIDGDHFRVPDRSYDAKGKPQTTMRTKVIRLIPNSAPQAIDLEQAPDAKGWSRVGIASLDDRTLTMHLTFPGRPRPRDFGAGGDREVVVLQRQD